MASIKVKFRPSSITDQKGTIFYQIIHLRKVRQFSSGHQLCQSDWDEANSRICRGRNQQAKAVGDLVKRDVDRLRCIIRRYENEGSDYTADDIVDEFNRYLSECSLFNYMEDIISTLRHNGRYGTAETYHTTANSFRHFLHETKVCPESGRDDDILLDCIDSRLMEAYEAWLHKRGVVPNTTSFYIRILRAVYKRAADAGMIEDHRPFRHVYTGIDKTVKRALPIEAVKRIRELDLCDKPALEYARDIFIMSFMFRGMSFIDMAFLRKKDLRNGYIVYRRRKTGQMLTIKWTKEMQTILDKYPENTSEYLLPIIKCANTNPRYAYRNMSYNINRSLKRIAEMSGIVMPLTMYVARHSWASAAKEKHIPLSVISEGLGHDNETTTQIYLASLDTSVVDRANRLILRSI